MRRVARNACAVLVALCGSVLVAGPARAADIPYDDPSAEGVLTLCGPDGEAIDHGSIDDRPFVVHAVSSSAAPSPYDADGRTAALLGYQPREAATPPEWSGELLTASARYTNPDHPMSAAVADDLSLGDFLGDFPAQWDGFVQLRLYLGVPGEPQLTQPYAAADIQVDGDEWTLVRGGDLACDVGEAVSNAEGIPIVTEVPPSGADPAAAGDAQATGDGEAPGESSAGETAASPSGTELAPALARSSGIGSGPIGIAAAALALLVGCLCVWRRRIGQSTKSD